MFIWVYGSASFSVVMLSIYSFLLSISALTLNSWFVSSIFLASFFWIENSFGIMWFSITAMPTSISTKVDFLDYLSPRIFLSNISVWLTCFLLPLSSYLASASSLFIFISSSLEMPCFYAVYIYKIILLASLHDHLLDLPTLADLFLITP